MNINTIKRKLHTFIRNPKTLPTKILYKMSPILSDEDYLNLLFPLKTGYKLNLQNPKTFNEKLQWLKLNYRKPIMTQMVDKYESKNYARNIIGDEYLIKTYGVWDSFEDINFDELPNQFVLKTTHDQGGVVIVKNKNSFDLSSARSKLNNHLKTEHYYLTREWPYKNVKPRIIAESLLKSFDGSDLQDYKFLCFDGHPRLMYIVKGRQGVDFSRDFFDMQFRNVGIHNSKYPPSIQPIERPINWDLMQSLASKLSQGWPHLRVDFYEVDGRVYVGELTFFMHGGLGSFPRKWDLELGSWINLKSLS